MLLHTLTVLVYMYAPNTFSYTPLSPPTANKVYGNRRTLEDAIKSGKCLYSVSGDNSYPMHDFYRCLTCESSVTDSIFVNCVKSCHKNHQVQFVRHDRCVCVCVCVL